MVKILVVKPKPGSLRSLFTKLGTINAKNGPFDLVLCISDLFADDKEVEGKEEEVEELLEGKVKLPVNTLCMVGRTALPEKVRRRSLERQGEICDNLRVLDPGSVTTLSTLEGIRIACFGGVYDPEKFNSADLDSTTSPYYITSESVTSFLARLQPSSTSAPKPIDILLSHSLPQLLTLHSSNPPKDPTAPAWGSPALTDVVKAVKPRYYFAGGEKACFWEREPWVWDEQDEVSGQRNKVTRFINLAEFGNKDKERWFYAFNLTPYSPSNPAPPPPPNSTPSPYSLPSSRKRPAPDVDFDDSAPDFRFGRGENGRGKRGKGQPGPPPGHYTCNICHTPGHWIQDCPQRADRGGRNEGTCYICNQPGHKSPDCPMAERDGGRRRGQKGPAPVREIGPENCWFCLSNPQVTKHLIAAIGSETYVTLPKGQLPDVNADCPVPGGGHVLIIPIAHYPSLLALPPDLALPIVSELETYKSALRSCYASFSASMVTFEVAKVSGPGGRPGHAHVQIVPVPKALEGEVERAFREEGARQGVEFEEGEEGIGEGGAETNYFRVGLPDGRVLVHRLAPNGRFNLQFGRVALANLLGTPHRADWKAASRSESDEKQECAAFKKAFAKFEPELA